MTPREILEEKTTEELHELLVQTCDEDSDELPDVDLIHAILDILKEREPFDREIDLEAARETIHEMIQMIMEEEENI